MLLKIERIILRKTSKNCDNSISLNEIGKYDGEDVYQAFLVLKEKGYFSMVCTTVTRSNFSYILTPKGKYYNENRRIEFVKNILIPIAVSIITATATYHLEKMYDKNSNKNTYEIRYEADNTNN